MFIAAERDVLKITRFDLGFIYSYLSHVCEAPGEKDAGDKARCENEDEREMNTTSTVCGSFDQSMPMFGTQDQSEKGNRANPRNSSTILGRVHD